MRPSHLSSALDRWLTPPWRALLTWLALAALSSAVQQYAWSDYIFPAISWGVHQMERLSPVPLPASIGGLAYTANVLLLFTWFEPIVLRLGPLRSIAWLAGRIIVALVWSLHFLPGSIARMFAYDILTGAAVIPALWGRRTRPWIPPVGEALGCVCYLLVRNLLTNTPIWLNNPIVAIPFAATLLYLTRPLPAPEAAEPAQDVSPL